MNETDLSLRSPCSVLELVELITSLHPSLCMNVTSLIHFNSEL